MNVWLKGLISAAISGAATAGLASVVDPHIIHDPTKLFQMAVGGAVVGVLNYLKQSPIPK